MKYKKIQKLILAPSQYNEVNSKLAGKGSHISIPPPDFRNHTDGKCISILPPPSYVDGKVTEPQERINYARTI